MEYYDVIIVGAGIAGCGLAYNLKKIGYTGSVLIIDKKEVGAHKGHGVRNTFGSTQKKYQLPYFQKYDGIKMYVYDEHFFTIEEEVFSMDYEVICKNLLNKSSAIFKQEVAGDTCNNTLITNKNNYRFQYLIDCSGFWGFLRKKLKMKAPLRYWIGNLHKIEIPIKSDLDKNYIHYSHGDNGYVEEINPHNKFATHGDWQFVKSLNFNLISPPKNSLMKKFLDEKMINEFSRGIIVNSPQFSPVRGNYVLLGDSMGTSPPSTAFGIRPLLELSELLSNAILINKLSIFEKQWKKNYFDSYIKYLVGKFDFFGNSKFVKVLKQYPSYYKIFKTILTYGCDEYFKI
ncbi:MAG: FAD-dependent oxidoreductase, partial [archaeon]